MISNQLKIALSTLLLTIGLSSSALAYDRHVLVVNNSSNNIIEFYGSNTGTEDWQEDILGVDVLASGEEVEVNFDDDTGYCMFDFNVVFDNETNVIEEQFNVCDLGTLTVTD